MLANGWSIALLICMSASLFLVGLASYTGLKIIMFWDPESDSERQIHLEGRTWLAAALIENGLAVQLLSLALLVIAAEQFSDMIAGAMCATGSFLANSYGTTSLYLKIAGIFFYGFWIVLHRLDLRSEHSPLIRFKFVYLLIILPFLLADSYYLVQYLYNLTPDIITSCCGVIFSDKALQTRFLIIDVSEKLLIVFYYFIAAILLLFGLMLARAKNHVGRFWSFLQYLFGVLWLVFFILTLVCITLFFSSYIYALPTHNCPFDIMHKQYNYIGVPIYFALFVSSFLAITSSAAALLRSKAGLEKPILHYQRLSARAASWLLVVHVILVSYPVVSYYFAGGEV